MIENSISNQALSVREIDANFPEEILKNLQNRFYHAQQEFDKMKKHQAELERKRGHKCPWAKKISEDFWVRRIRKQWAENSVEDGVKSRRGPKGWGFLTMLKIWIYAAFFGVEQNAAEIHNMLGKNPLYAQLCGLPGKPIGQEIKYELPAERTIRHFNQVMYTFGLWGDFKRLLVFINLEQGVFQWSDELIIDPTHLDAFASVGKKCLDCKHCPKSDHCNFSQNSCEMTGIVSKSKNFKLPGVKLTFACLPGSEIVIEALACRGQVHDSKLLKPILEKLSQDYPELRERVKKVLADGAYDGRPSRETTQEVVQAELVTPVNPGNRKPILNPADAIAEITPYGVPVCDAGHEMILAGRDHQREQFIWVCPVFNEQHGDPGLHCSDACKHKCCPDANNGRVFRVARELTAQVNWDNPQYLASVKKVYNHRTSVERSISRFKRIMKFDRFYNRGPKPLQAHGDRYVIDVQLIAFIAHKLGRAKATRRCRLTG